LSSSGPMPDSGSSTPILDSSKAALALSSSALRSRACRASSQISLSARIRIARSDFDPPWLPQCFPGSLYLSPEIAIAAFRDERPQFTEQFRQIVGGILFLGAWGLIHLLSSLPDMILASVGVILTVLTRLCMSAASVAERFTRMDVESCFTGQNPPALLHLSFLTACQTSHRLHPV
jgi:hypothetical protein